MKTLLYILFFLLPWLSLMAQESYSWQLTDEEGLPTMVIYDLYQDSKGAIWIGTDAGICRYNGRTIKSYSHPNQKGTSMTRIREDKLGRIWCKNFNGQLFFVENNQLNLFPIPDSLVLSAYLLHDFFDGQLFFNAQQGILKYDLEKASWNIWKSEKLGIFTKVIPSFVIDIKSFLMLTRQDNNIYHYDGVDWNYKTNIDEKIKVSHIKSFSTDTLLVFSRNEVYLGAIGELSTLSKQVPFLSGESIIDLQTLSNKDVAIFTANGVFLFRQNKAGELILERHLLAGMQISSVILDREGSYWVGTLNSGVYVFPNLNVLYYNDKNSSLANSAINDIAQDNQNNLLLALGNGTVAQFSTQKKQVEKIYLGDTSTNVTAVLYAPKQQQLLYFNKGLYVKDFVTNKTSFYSATLGGHQLGIFRDSLMLIGDYSNSFVVRLTPSIGRQPILYDGGWRFYKIKEKNTKDSLFISSIRHHRTNTIHADITSSDKFWIGYDDSLICYHKNSNYAILDEHQQSIVSFDLNQSSDGMLWVGTVSNGVLGLKNDQVIYHLTMKDGLPSNTCYTIYCDGHQVWGGTNKGIFKFDINTKTIFVFDKLDGLLSENIKDITIANGMVWASNAKGLISFDKNLNPHNQQQPSIQILDVQENNNFLPRSGLLELSSTQNNLRFTFEGISLASRGQFQYYYRLLGVDTIWRNLEGEARSIQFQALETGAYNFQIRVENEDGVLSVIEEYKFVILSPYWRKWWVQLFIYLLIAGVVALVLTIINRSKRKQDQQYVQMGELRMQALQSQLNPHFVFNSLNAIQSYWIHNQTKEAMSYHSKFAKLMRLIFDYSGELTIDIEDEIEFLKTYISLERLRFEDKIDVQFLVDEEMVDVFIPPLMIQPLIENSFKHGFLHQKEKGHLLIHFKKEGDYLHVLIQDNGVGRKVALQNQLSMPQHKEKRSSMAIIQERLSMLNQLFGKDKTIQALKIIDLKDKEGNAVGTNVEIWIPLMNK